MKKIRIICLCFALVLLVGAISCMFLVESTWAKYSATSEGKATVSVTYGETRCTGGVATCTQKAICDICGNEYGDYGHTGNEVWSYSESGHWKLWSCCGSISQNISEHTYVDNVCTSCGRLNHTHVLVSVAAKAATCTEDGNIAYQACECGKMWNEDGTIEILPTSITIEATGHKWYLATCFAPKTCQNCHETEGVALEHNLQTLEAVEPTCTSTGLTAGEYCTLCNTIIVAQEAIDKTAHDTKPIPLIEATCTEGGMTAGEVCKTCGTITVSPQYTPATGHSITTLSAVPATCTATGLSEGAKCTECGLITVEQEVTDALGHHEVATPALEPTCTQAGHTAGTRCDRAECNTVLVAQETRPATGHTEVAMADVAPTCTDKGYEGGMQCSVCSTITVARTEIPALNHLNDVNIAGVEPTCGDTGLTAGVQCSRCGTLTTPQSIIPAKGHTEETLAGKAPTCLSVGISEGKRCSVCGDILVAQTIIPKSGHTETTLPAKDSTCTATGLTEGTQCSVCNAIIVAQQTVPMKAHTAAGSYSSDANNHWEECTVCGYNIGSTVHTAAASYSTDGTYHWKECSACGYDIGKTGHTAASTYSMDATNHWKDCTVCGYDTNKGAHTASSSWSTDGTNHWKDCTVCGYDTNKGAHSESGWKTDGTNHWKICTTCSRVTTAASAHTASSSWSTDGTNHWRDCTTCGYDMNKAAHTSTNGGTAGVHTKCSVCSRTLSSTHSYSKTTQAAATCTANGTSKYTCGCGYSYTSQDIAALGHNTTVQDNWQINGTNCSGKATCSRCNVSVTPTVFFDAYWIGTTNLAYAYDSRGAGVDQTHGQAWALLQANTANGAYLHLNKNNALMGKYIVVHYGNSNVPTGSQINVVVNNGGSGLVNWRMANPGRGFTSSLFALNSSAGDNPFYMNINGSIIYIRGIATFNDINQARAYQDLLTGITYNDGRKTTNSGDATKVG